MTDQQGQVSREIARSLVYKIVEVLSRGRTGVIYKALDPAQDRFLAIKLLRSDRADSTNLKRLQNEAKVGALVKHANLVTTFELAVLAATKEPYLIMEYVAG